MDNYPLLLHNLENFALTPSIMSNMATLHIKKYDKQIFTDLLINCLIFFILSTMSQLLFLQSCKVIFKQNYMEKILIVFIQKFQKNSSLHHSFQILHISFNTFEESRFILSTGSFIFCVQQNISKLQCRLLVPRISSISSQPHFHFQPLLEMRLVQLAYKGTDPHLCVSSNLRSLMVNFLKRCEENNFLCQK